MNIIVQKYGGSSVSNIENLFNVCSHITRAYNKGDSVVVVVSAQGKTTDKLLQEGLDIDNNLSKRELDVLLSVGEQISISKLAICLNKLGYKVKSFTGWQVPIITTNKYGDAEIIDIKTDNILKALNDKYIVIVAGFQGVDEENNITTLGRGGSDATAVALSASLNAHKLEIYKDVDGVYSSDPNIDKNAVKYYKISYDDMIKLAESGAKVLQKNSIEIAKKYKIPIIVKSVFLENSQGTVVK